MYNFSLFLHSALRWVILILFVVDLIFLFKKDAANAINYSKWLLISIHTNLLIGLYQYFIGGSGIIYFQQFGAKAVMHDTAMRFWAVEHITGMLIAIILVTIGHVKLKKTLQTKQTAILYTIAFVLIIASIPWPFREAIARPLFHSL